jgi:myo-inositol 2-dehydrogenase/D-chiro-inositol 1-dehydrogenase
MIHDFDYARWVAGEVIGVRAERDDFGGVNRAEAWLTHAGGARSHVVGQWGGIVGDRFDITGSAGRVRSCDMDPDGTDEAELAFDAQLADFSNAIRTGEPARVTAADGLAALRIALAAAESQRTGDSIELSADAS